MVHVTLSLTMSIVSGMAVIAVQRPTIAALLTPMTARPAEILHLRARLSLRGMDRPAPGDHGTSVPLPSADGELISATPMFIWGLS